MTLSKDQFFGACEVQWHEVNLPELGGSLWVRTLDSDEKIKHEMRFLDDNGNLNTKKIRDAKYYLVVATVYDAKNGKLYFHEDDLPKMRKVRAAVLEKLSDKAMEINGMTRSKGIEDLSKNS